jgi:hypothetical protein
MVKNKINCFYLFVITINPKTFIVNPFRSQKHKQKVNELAAAKGATSFGQLAILSTWNLPTRPASSRVG